jgi:cytoskeletal protein CcmA (bactofilin family)
MRRHEMLRRRRREGGEVAAEQGEPGIKEALGPETTVVRRGAQVEGTMVSAESIRIEGEAKGKIDARGDVILSSHSRVEADIRAQNVVLGGTVKGNITARTKTELAQGGKVEGKIQSKVLVVREGAMFSGQSNMDLGDAPGHEDGTGYPEDDLQVAYDEAVRRAAAWFRTRFYGSSAGPDREHAARLDALTTWEPEETPELEDGICPSARRAAEE